jgi:hypothetical protein
MTYRKLDALFKEHCLFNGIELKRDIDDIIPGEDVI